MNNFLSGKKCLFFGSENCIYSQKCIDKLQKYGMEVTIIFSNKRGEKLPAEAFKWKGDFIFSFRNYWLLPDSILKNAKLMALNFHPGTPDFPGSGSYSWALYENSKVFGIIVHQMNQKFDNGKIFDVYTFPIEKCETVETLIKKTLKFLLTTFENFVKKLSNKTINEIQKMIVEPSKFNWSRQARTIKDIDKMSKLDVQLSSDELSRRIRAFHHEKFPVYIEHKGFRFRYDSKI